MRRGRRHVGGSTSAGFGCPGSGTRATGVVRRD